MDNGWRKNKYGGLFNIFNKITPQKEKETNKYMNQMIRKKSKKGMTLQDYIIKKEQRQGPLQQAFGVKPKEEKFRYKAKRLLQEAEKRKRQRLIYQDK